MVSLLRSALGMAALLALPCLAEAGPLTERQGRWLGDMAIPNGPTLKIGAELFTRLDGTAWASLASPDQGVYDIPAATVTETADSVELDLRQATLKLIWAQDHFEGVFSQGGQSYSFPLQRVAAFPYKARPQTPKGPFPYTSRDLKISAPGGIALGATLSLPHGVKRPTLVVIVAGSGPATRDAVIAGHQPYNVMADHLARQGIAVLRYDKRGNGRSSGDFAQVTTAQLIDDLGAIVKSMKERREFRQVGLVGLSEGPGIAAAVAARSPRDVDFIVSLAGVGLPGHQLILLQDRFVARDNGAQPQEVERLMVYVDDFYKTILAHPEPGPRVAALKALHAGLSAEEQAMVKKYRMNYGSLSIAEAEKPHLRTLLMANPQEDWRKVKVPVLALNGSLDHQVPAEESLAGIVGALEEGGNRKVESAILPSLNHLFQTAKTGATKEYATIDETIAPSVLDRIAAFVKKQK
ncbi:MAG: alpha/beta fold hydrolase [Pseudomonadota bacterium]